MDIYVYMELTDATESTKETSSDALGERTLVWARGARDKRNDIYMGIYIYMWYIYIYTSVRLTIDRTKNKDISKDQL